MSSSEDDKGPAPRGNRIRTAMFVLTVVACAVVAVGLGWYLNLPEPPLPNLSEIERMQATIPDGPPRGSVVFDVPRSHWQAIYSAMQPAHKDEHPAKWVSPGDLNLTLKGGESFYIGLYYVDADLGSGAFSAGPTFEKRVYYRGGNSAKLEKALADALNAYRATGH
jgi:hypothetical protein